MSADNPIRIGLFSCTKIVRKLSRAINLSPNATISAIATTTTTTSSIEEAKSFAESNNFPPNTRIHSSYESLLEDPDVDAVYLPIPASLHVEWAVRAARQGKHILLDKPVALNVSEFDQIVEACEVHGVQFMDGTHWMHNPRTAKIMDFMKDFEIKTVHSCFSFAANENFLKHDNRVKPGLDGLGALGDAGWYTIQAALVANNFKLPKTVTTLPGPVLNDDGIVLSCGALLDWEEGITATIYCSFLANLTMEITAVGAKGTVKVHDFVIPYRETEASFTTSIGGCLSEHKVMTVIPQEACMVIEFARLVGEIKNRGAKPDGFWLSFSRKTQLLVDAVKESIDNNLEPVILSGR